MVNRLINSIIQILSVIVLLSMDVLAIDDNDSGTGNGRTTSFQQFVDLSYEHPDSALFLIEKSISQSALKRDPKLHIAYLHALSDIRRSRMEYDTAYKIAGRALGLSIITNDTLLLIDSYSKYGKINYAFLQEKEALNYLNKSLFLSKLMVKQGKLDIQKLVSSYFDMVLYRQRFAKFDEALAYLDSCYIIADTVSLSKLSLAYLDAEKGYLLLNKLEADMAMKYLQKAKEAFEHIDEAYADVHAGYLANVYSYLGEAYRLKRSYNQSMQYFEKALDVLEKYSRHNNHRPYILEHYAWLLYDMGDYEKANEYLNHSIRIGEKYLSAKSFTENDFLVYSNRLRSFLNQRRHEIMLKNLELAKKDKAIFRFRIFTISAVFMILVGLLLFRNKKREYRHNLEKADIIAQENQAKNDVKLKNKELTASTLKLIEKDQIIRTAVDELNKYKTESSKAFISSVRKSSINMWDDFNSRFLDVNEGFYDNLTVKYPGLTHADLKICALIKLNFSTKEMAHLLGISNESVQKARYRVRKKLKLNRDVNLTSFIASI